MGDYKDWINQNPLTTVESGSLHFCLEYREAEVAGQIVELTAKEFDILALLILNPRRVFTYEMIMDIIWKEDYNFYSKKAIHNHVSNLKRKLRELCPEHDFIVSVHGIGYKFNPMP